MYICSLVCYFVVLSLVFVDLCVCNYDYVTRWLNQVCIFELLFINSFGHRCVVWYTRPIGQVWNMEGRVLDSGYRFRILDLFHCFDAVAWAIEGHPAVKKYWSSSTKDSAVMKPEKFGLRLGAYGCHFQDVLPFQPNLKAPCAKIWTTIKKGSQDAVQMCL